LGDAFRTFRGWTLLLLLALVYVGAMFLPLYESFGQIGFDFKGTIWEPARAVLDGRSMYPEPTRAAMELGNPAVYPPFVPLLALPLAFLPLTVAALAWMALLALGTAWALWLLGVRDARCYLVALVSAPVMQGLLVGNLTLLLLLPLALAWRYRDHALAAGVAVGVAVAAKLFVWPLIVWLLITRRFAAAAWALASAAVLVLVPWALVGFDGLLGYPALLDALQHHFAPRSFSTAALAASVGIPVSIAVVLCEVLGLALLALAWWLVGRPEGHRRSFAVVVVACIVASPVVWPFYAALLFVPIAVTWPRLNFAWFFGYLVALVALVPGLVPSEHVPCCRPPDVPSIVWGITHSWPEPWAPLVFFVVVSAVMVAHLAPRSTIDHPRP
jgi:hypothetical protein